MIITVNIPVTRMAEQLEQKIGKGNGGGSITALQRLGNT
jgi:hypothetical protein